jgi:Leucine-rich repeat (LRR) protein/uncharacterized protein YjdB
MRNFSFLFIMLILAVGVASCSDSPSDPVDDGPELGEFEAGPAGGEISFASGVSLDVPAGALSSVVEFTVDVSDTQNPVGDEHQVGQLYAIGPTGTSFAQPVRIRIPLPAGFSGNVDDLLLLTRDGAGNALVTGDIEVSGGEISGTTSSLSPYWASEAGGAVAEFEVSPSTVEVGGGGEVSLTAEARNLAGDPVPGVTVEWSSDQPEVAAVSSGGVITGGLVGEAEITATVDEHTATVAVTVVPGAVATIEVSPPAAGIQVEETLTLTAVARDEPGNVVPDAAINWSSDDESVAVVDDNGEVLGVAGGSTVVRATGGSAEGSSAISVTEATPDEVVITGLPGSVQSGDTLTLNAQVLDEGGGEIQGAEVVWTVSDESVLEPVSANQVRAILVGTAQVTATAAGGVSASESISVVPGPAHTIELLPADPEVTVGGTTALTAEVQDLNGNVVSATLAWSSADPETATVSNLGIVTGVSEGVTEITVQAGAAIETVTINVVAAAIASIVISPEDPVVGVGATIQLTATVLDENQNAVTAPLTWSSDNAGVATVGVGGFVTGVAEGSAGITAQFDSIQASVTVQVVDDSDPVVIFPDATLEGVIRDALDQPEGDILASDVAALTSVNFGGPGGISNLGGLEYATGLTLLSLRNQEITDLSPLSGLEQIQYLDFRDNSISSIAPLAGLTALRILILDDNDVADISALAGKSELTGLQLANNPVSDLSPISGATGLTSLNLRFTGVSDVSMIGNFTDLNTLHLSGLGLTDADIAFVEDLTSLTMLYVDANQLTEISFASNLTDLTTLGVAENQVSDLTPVANLASLSTLTANSNNLTTATGVENLVSLTNLGLADNQITDLQPIVDNSHFGQNPVLYFLFLTGNPLSETARCVQIPELEARGPGVNISFSGDPCDE